MRTLWVDDINSKAPKEWLEAYLSQAVELLVKRGISLPENQEIVIVLASPQQVAKLNQEFRGKNKPTDVLSFTSEDPGTFGELILCPEVIESQAQGNSWGVQFEYAYMILHGILHLLGFDHEKGDKEAAEMYGLQDSVFFELFPGEQNVHRN